MPRSDVKPMKATLVDEPFDDPNWRFEIKWDGYRALASLEDQDAVLISRNNIVFDKYYPLNEVLGSWHINAVLDGEVVVLNEKGQADFNALQNWRSEADGHLIYYVFDVLWYEGRNTMELPLLQRQTILKELLPTGNDHVRLSESFAGSGIDFFKKAEGLGLEGIMAKKADSVYTSDTRSKDWLKIKVRRRQEVVIVGYTRNEDTAKPFSALLIGVYDGKKLRYAGKVGTGFSTKMQRELLVRFNTYITHKSPFDVEPDVDKPSRFRPQRLGAKPTW